MAHIIYRLSLHTRSITSGYTASDRRAMGCLLWHALCLCVGAIVFLLFLKPVAVKSVRQLFRGPAPRSPLHRLSIRLRHSRSCCEWSVGVLFYYELPVIIGRNTHRGTQQLDRFKISFRSNVYLLFSCVTQSALYRPATGPSRGPSPRGFEGNVLITYNAPLSD